VNIELLKKYEHNIVDRNRITFEKLVEELNKTLSKISSYIEVP